MKAKNLATIYAIKVSENPYKALSEVEILEKLEKAREHSTQGMYKDACDVSRDMRAKYGL